MKKVVLLMLGLMSLQISAFSQFKLSVRAQANISSLKWKIDDYHVFVKCGYQLRPLYFITKDFYFDEISSADYYEVANFFNKAFIPRRSINLELAGTYNFTKNLIIKFAVGATVLGSKFKNKTDRSYFLNPPNITIYYLEAPIWLGFRLNKKFYLLGGIRNGLALKGYIDWANKNGREYYQAFISNTTEYNCDVFGWRPFTISLDLQPEIALNKNIHLNFNFTYSLNDILPDYIDGTVPPEQYNAHLWSARFGIEYFFVK